MALITNGPNGLTQSLVATKWSSCLQGMESQHLAVWAVAPSVEELELLIIGVMPVLASLLGVRTWSW